MPVREHGIDMAHTLADQKFYRDSFVLCGRLQGEGVIVEHLLGAHAHPDGRQTRKVPIDGREIGGTDIVVTNVGDLHGL